MKDDLLLYGSFTRGGSGGGGAPQPIVKQITFGRNASIDGNTVDTFGNCYMVYNSGNASTADEAAFIRAYANDILKKISIAVGGTDAGDVVVGLYSAQNIQGGWTLVKQFTVAAAPTGASVIIDQAVNVPLTKGLYYFLAVNSPTVQLCQLGYNGGIKRWTAAEGVMPATVADADSSTSNFLVNLYGTVERTVTP